MTAEPMRVLLVEDEPGHAELAIRAFEGWMPHGRRSTGRRRPTW
jgi:hypothetical protein